MDNGYKDVRCMVRSEDQYGRFGHSITIDKGLPTRSTVLRPTHNAQWEPSVYM